MENEEVKNITFDKEDLRRIKDKELSRHLWDSYKDGTAKEVPDPKEVKIKMQYAYAFIKEGLKKYLHMNEQNYTLITLWIMGTYSHEDFMSYPYLFVNGMRGSG